MAAGARAIGLPVPTLLLMPPPPSEAKPDPRLIRLRRWPPWRKRRRRPLNEPTRPTSTVNATSSSQWELYRYHKQNGTLGVYFDLYPGG